MEARIRRNASSCCARRRKRPQRVAAQRRSWFFFVFFLFRFYFLLARVRSASPSSGAAGFLFCFQLTTVFPPSSARVGAAGRLLPLEAQRGLTKPLGLLTKPLYTQKATAVLPQYMPHLPKEVPSGRQLSKGWRGEGVKKEERGEGWRGGSGGVSRSGGGLRRQGQGKVAVVRNVRVWGEEGVMGV